MDPDRLSKAFVSLVELMARLRGPHGCPWDVRQTDSTIMIYLLEEAYEVLDAIEKSSPEDVCSELGDLMFQILFIAQLASERNEFDIAEVIEKITEKMINRHPHVFGKAKAETAEEVACNWARIKKMEKDSSPDTSSYLESVPVALPALLRTHRLTERASKVDFDKRDNDEIWKVVQKNFDGLKTAVGSQDKEQVGKKIGDFLFCLVNLTRHWELNAEHLLRFANRKFYERFGRMERELKASGIELEEATPEQIKLSWQNAGNQAES